MNSRYGRNAGCNVVVSLRHRATGHSSWNSIYDPLHRYAEIKAATLSTDNQKAELPPQTRSTFSLAFSPSSDLLASCHCDHNVYVSEVKTGKLVKTLIGHKRSPWCVTFHPTSNDILATGCLNSEVSRIFKV